MRVEGIKQNEIQQYNLHRTGSGENMQRELGMNKDAENIPFNQKKYTQEELESAIGTVNKAINPYDRRLEFSIHEATKLISVKVIDTNTDEVIREIPPEKILDMVARLWELAGIIVDKKI